MRAGFRALSLTPGRASSLIQRLFCVGLAGLSLALPRLAAASGFVENAGQLDPPARYSLEGAGASFFLSPSGVVLDYRDARPEEFTRGGGKSVTPATTRSRHAVVSRYLDASPSAWIEARERLPEARHFLLGAEPAAWRHDVASYGELIHHDVWPGIDIEYRVVEGMLEAQVVSAPGADLSRIAFVSEGADALHPAFALGETHPTGERRGPVGAATTNDPARLHWSTFLGGSSDEIAWGSAVDSQGNTLVVGLTISSHFPTTVGAYDESYNGFGDVFLSKLDPAGNLIWSTVLGGTSGNFDYGYAVALDTDDRPIVTGYAFSADFPTTAGAFDPVHHDGADAFVAKLSENGAQLLWSTFLGGNAHDIGYSVALDSAGRPVVGGRTISSDFPLTGGAMQPFNAGEEDGFITKLAADGSQLVWSTYYGGEGYDGVEDIALDAEDHVVLLGFTASTSFPVTPGVEDESYNGGLYDTFVTQLDAQGHAAWSRYLGGDGADYGNALAVDEAGNAHVTGQTESADFPTSDGAYDESFNGGGADAFVAKLAGANGDLEWGTFLGGSDGYYETGFGIGLVADGVVVAGSTPSFDYPVTADAYDTSYNGVSDVFLAKLNAAGSALAWSSFVGGTSEDYGYDLALVSQSEAVVVGSTASTNYPTTFGAYDTMYNGGDSDVFVSRVRFGTGTTAVGSPSLPVDARFDLRVFPNPTVAGDATVSFRLGRPGMVSLELLSATGRRIARTSIGRLGSGHHEMRWSARSGELRTLPAGVYYLRLVDGDRTERTAITILK